MTVQKNTPMMEQFLSIKERYSDSILFYRMGDFYEMFLDDAVKAAAILEITLTSRNKTQDNPIPMCGVPYKAADTYIAKLIENGCKVAVCEQVEDPGSAKGLVKREVVRVITPGMILNEELLDKGSNNFLAAICVSQGFAGLSYLDISTGMFRTTEAPAKNGKIPPALIDEALRIDAKELLLPASFDKDPFYSHVKRPFAAIQISYLDGDDFKLASAKKRLTEKFRTRSLQGFGCEDLTAGTAAAGAILAYVQETQLQDTDHILTLENYELNSYLLIDDRSCRNLELLKNIQNGDKKGSLISVLDKTITAMGGRLLKNWIRYPLIHIDGIEQRLDAVAEAKENPGLRQSLRTHLKEVYDLERLGSKISMGHGNARDLTALKTSLYKLPQLFNDLNQLTSPLFQGELIEAREQVSTELFELADLINRAIRPDAPIAMNEGGIICDGYNEELDEILEIARDGRSWIAKTGAKEKEKTGLSSLKIKFNKVFGYFIEVSKVQSQSVPDHYIRKQTLVNAERFITDELKEVESKVLNAQDKRATLEYSLFCKVRESILQKTPSILKMAKFLACVDVLLALATAAEENNYTRPELNRDKVLEIKEGRHPVVEKMIIGERYVPNSIRLDNDDDQVLIITGPNMAGKSTVLRQVALMALMAQMGSFVPAEHANLCVIDRIFTRVGALDNLALGQSTFMVEMEETANIVNNAKQNSLVILDEIGRGTSTFDGMSIAWAVAEYLHDLDNKGVKTLFATHYHELTRLEQLKPRVKNFNIAVKEFNDNIIFLRRLVRGGTNKSYGIQVARLAGVPDQVIAKAKEILAKIESNGKEVEPDAAPVKTMPAAVEKKQDQQMDLFENHDHDEIISALEATDISTMTPIEALNLVHNLKQKIRSKALT